jgi:predicted nucleotidyltransferase component of viral defense system
MLDLEQIESFYPEFIRPYRRNILREYLQYKILEVVFRSRAAAGMCFMGGTCIHMVHGNPRFSEDLDFDNRGLSRGDFRLLASDVAKALEREGYSVELKTSFRNAFRAQVRFVGILSDMGLSPHASEKMLIRIDAEPQDFEYDPDKIILNKFDVFARINTVPADVLLAQKFACILGRKRPMGRDFLDAVFLMGKTQPCMKYLKSKLEIEDLPALKREVLATCEKLDFGALAKDVEPFVIDENDTSKVEAFPEYIETAL